MQKENLHPSDLVKSKMCHQKQSWFNQVDGGQEDSVAAPQSPHQWSNLTRMMLATLPRNIELQHDAWVLSWKVESHKREILLQNQRIYYDSKVDDTSKDKIVISEKSSERRTIRVVYKSKGRSLNKNGGRAGRGSLIPPLFLKPDTPLALSVFFSSPPFLRRLLPSLSFSLSRRISSSSIEESVR